MRFKRSASQHARPWYPMGNTIVNGRGRGVCRHPHSYCFDPLPRCRPRSDGAEDAPPRRPVFAEMHSRFPEVSSRALSRHGPGAPAGRASLSRLSGRKRDSRENHWIPGSGVTGSRSCSSFRVKGLSSSVKSMELFFAHPRSWASSSSRALTFSRDASNIRF